MDKIKFLMSDTGAEITAACREALEQKGVEVTVDGKRRPEGPAENACSAGPRWCCWMPFMPGLDALAVNRSTMQPVSATPLSL